MPQIWHVIGCPQTGGQAAAAGGISHSTNVIPLNAKIDFFPSGTVRLANESLIVKKCCTRFRGFSNTALSAALCN